VPDPETRKDPGATAPGSYRRHNSPVLPGPLPSLVDRSGHSAGPTSTAWLATDDGVRISAAHWAPSLPDGPTTDSRCAYVLGHGFTGSWETHSLQRAAGWFAQHGGVVAVSFRGHGRSGGRSTVGDQEVLDLQEAVRWARHLGYERIVTVGFSMGASIVVRHVSLLGGVDAAVSVSSPSRWYYRGTAPMRLVHWGITGPAGRFAVRLTRRTRIANTGWDPEPVEPRVAAASLGPTRLLVVHGEVDHYFPLDHAQQIADAAGERGELWVEPGFGHAENALPEALAHRIAIWGLARPKLG
jgi:pimeloyl-ACP methyl ester carboxylesterase